MLTLVVAIALLQTPQPLLGSLREALANGDAKIIKASFVNPADSEYLFEMAASRTGLKNLKVAIFPAPPSWKRPEKFWATFHTYQDLEEDHDPIYPVIQKSGKWKLGKEIPEDQFGSEQTYSANCTAKLNPAAHSVDVFTLLNVGSKGQFRSPVFRLNDIYNLTGCGLGETTAKIVFADDHSIADVPSGAVLRAGGLVLVYAAAPFDQIRFNYAASIDEPGQDRINPKECYLTAGWLPSLGMLPYRARLRITGIPDGWTLRSEGGEVPIKKGVATTFNPFPISFHKIVGGAYTLAAEKNADGRVFRAYQFDPVDKQRAQQTVDRMAEAAHFYDSTLTPFPFKGYDCFDGDDYYGIESYSYTLLAPRITLRYVAHEMGHTYFGGLVPCTYVKDSWNEGVTTYVDDVLTGRNVDHPLEAALRTLDVHVPLNQMGPAHAFKGASYWRGAAVMKMLEHEIGLPAVLSGLRLLIQDREGKDTTWDDLRPYFEKSSAKDLKWFWNQWIDNAEFPTITAAQEPVHNVHIEQSGTSRPYRIRLLLKLHTPGGHMEKEVAFSTRTLDVPLGMQPKSLAAVQLEGYTLGRLSKTKLN